MENALPRQLPVLNPVRCFSAGPSRSFLSASLVRAVALHAAISSARYEIHRAKQVLRRKHSRRTGPQTSLVINDKSRRQVHSSTRGAASEWYQEFIHFGFVACHQRPTGLDVVVLAPCLELLRIVFGRIGGDRNQENGLSES